MMQGQNELIEFEKYGKNSYRMLIKINNPNEVLYDMIEMELGAPKIDIASSSTPVIGNKTTLMTIPTYTFNFFANAKTITQRIFKTPDDYFKYIKSK